MKRKTGIVAALMALMACLLAAGCAGESGSVDNAITVSATAVAQITPDKAAVTVVVAGSGDSHEAAVSTATNSANNVVAHMKTLGVAEDKITVRDPEIVERYGEPILVQEPFGGYVDEFGNWIEGGVNEYYVDGSGEIVGYDAVCRVYLAEFEARSLGQVAREAVAAGAIDFADLSFTVSDREAAYRQALSEAVDAAHVKAESLAKASDVYVGRLVNLAENSSADFEGTVRDEENSLRIDDERTFDIMPAKVPVEASVTVSYAIS